MKKIVAVTVVLFCMGALRSVNAQQVNLDDINSLTFYGVDFSHARVYGAEESGRQFLGAFEGINNLFESEPKKYSASKTFGVSSDELFNRQVKRDIDNISTRDMFTDDNRYVVADADIHRLVSKLERQGDDQYGAVIVCGLLNKTTNRGTFTFVIFDQDTREIVLQQEHSGKARGFGLRNFWAGALLSAMKDVE